VHIPGIAYGATPKAGGQVNPRNLGQPPKLVVVHCTSNATSNAAGEANYAATRTDPQRDWTSAHAYVDAGGALGSLDLGLQAWAAFSWANTYGWHVELCGKENAVPDQVQRTGAALVRQLCILGNIPMEHLDGTQVRALHDGSRTRGGVTGHYDITRAAIDSNNHTDPGTAFDWGRFMGWVNQHEEETDMGSVWDEQIGAGFTPGGAAYGDNLFRTAVGYTWYRADQILSAIQAGNVADETRDKAMMAAIEALKASGSSVDTAAVIARINEVGAEQSATVTQILDDLADARHRLAAALAGQ
jgi:hypothetical protein